MIDPKSILLKLNKNLNILREREAKYGGNAPVDLLNQISDHQQAIDLTQQLIAGEITKDEWQAATKPLLAFSGGEVVNIEAKTYIVGDINLIVQGDYVTNWIVNEKESIFSGLLNRFILAQNLTFGIVISYLRDDPFPYAKSLKLVALCISADNKEVEDWFKEWFSELDALINNPKTDSDLNKIASELWLVTELIEISYAKNKGSTERLATLVADFQRIRSKAIEFLSNYSQELARAQSNLVHLQGVLHNSSLTIQGHLEIVARWIGLLTSNYTNTLKNFTPTNLVKEIADYITRNPDRVSPSILGVLSNVKNLLIWTIEWTSKNSESNFESKLGKLLSSFPDVIPPTPLPAGSSSINQLTFVLQHTREQFQILASNREEIKRLHHELNKLTEDNSHLEVRLSDSNEQINQKDKTLQGKINEIKQLNLAYANLESKQLEIERKLANITHDMNQQEEAPPIERMKGEKAVTTSELVRWAILKRLWQESEIVKSDSSFLKYTKYPTGSIDLDQSSEDLYSRAKIDPQFRQQVLRGIDDLKVSRQSSTDAYLKALKEIETRFRRL